ncbi:PREDICTED: transforming growth factor-beta receptor-associated protein 1 [Ipomoea nil]|uniref:transforming growth factor-beta receptor-associated protein 1 n=1 Tax=Ipomoea nil TaxID=35883 RepID=UPI000900A7FF|nr:PREDICTED: transforming growth factor-beta receptor-associated protein 1 [Ipomoea nil]
MANPKPSTKPEPESKSRSRTVLKLLAEFNPLDSNSSQIRSLAISTLSDSQALIYLGTTSGSLLSLSVNPNSPSTSSALVCHRQVTVGGGPVNSIHVLDDIGKIIVVSDGFLYLVDLLLLDPIKKLSLIKGVTALTRRFRSSRISTGGDNVVQRLNGMKLKEDGCFFAVAVGKKLVLVELVFSGSLVILKEFPGVSEGINSLAWVDDSIIFGTRNGYYLYSCSSGQSGLLFSLPDLSGPPLMKILCKEWKVMLMMDNVGVIVDAEGQPVGGSLVFREAPDSIGELGSCVVVMRNGKVELYHRKSGNCVQRVPFDDEVGNKCIVADEGNDRGKLVALATSSKVICYQKVPPEDQIKDLLRKKNVGEAVSLIDELWNEGEITKDMLSFVHAQVGFLLLFDLHFAEAVDHFLLSETMQPSELFPFIMREPNRWSLLVPRNRYWGLHPPPSPLEKVIDDGLMAVQRAIFLKKAGVESAVDDKFLLNPPSRADLLEVAVKSMTRYLEVSRFKDLTLPVKEGVDTLLMYLYRALNRIDDMEKLASSDNNCVVEELESLLNESGHLRTLAFLYASKGLSSKALAIWRILARNSSNMKEPAVVNDLQDNSKSVDSDQATAVIEASKILEESSDQDLVLQHLGWISDINQVLAVQVLISEKRMDLLSPDDVIAAIDPKKVEILLRYLQWLIEDKELDDTQFHTTYALLLAKSALDAYEIEHLSENSIFDSHVRERLQIFLQSSDLYDPEEVLDLIEGSELWMEKAILYRKLGQEALVLQILALKLEDCEAAEQYCAEIGRPDAYMQLLDMYLDPMNGKEPMFAAAVRLLHNHGEMLDPLQVLERLSPDMPLQLASETMLRMLRARLHHHHQGQIVHNLSRALEVDASLARLEERSRHVLINDESVCDSCHARLGTKLFAMYPDDTIVCYKCFRRQGESTSVTGRNFKEDSLYKPGWLVTR